MKTIKKKCALLIIDGLGDLPVEDLGGLTPLEAATTPVMDRLASSGWYGPVDPIGPGEIPNTHSGCSLLLGLLPEQVSRVRRGPVEASGAGWTMKPGEVAMRANFASVVSLAGGLHVTDRRAGRISSGTDVLAEELKDLDLGDGVRANLIATDQHRGALVLSGSGLDESVTDTDPGDKSLPTPLEPCMARKESARFTASKINAFISEAYSRLHDHPLNKQRIEEGKFPANAVITRGSGEWFGVNHLFSKPGIRVSLVAGTT